MDPARTQVAAGWTGLAAALSAALLYAIGTWTGPLEPFLDRPWALLTTQALSVLLWVGLPSVAGWLLLRGDVDRRRTGAGLLAAYGLPAGPQIVGTFVSGGSMVTWQGVGFGLYGALLVAGAVTALAALLSDRAFDIHPPGRWSRAPLRVLVVIAVAVSAVLYTLPLVDPGGAANAFEAFRHGPLAMQIGGLLGAAGLIAVAYLAVAVNLPRVGAAMLAGAVGPLLLHWMAGLLGRRTEWLGTREPVALVIEGLALAIIVGGAALVARERLAPETGARN